MQFYPGDWMRDAGVRQCSPATRGIWFDMLCLMHDAGRTGELIGTVESLARATGCSPTEFEQALRELAVTKVANVTKRPTDVTVINRRMRREHIERVGARQRKQKQRLNGSGPAEDSERKGRNPRGVTKKSRLYSSSSSSNTHTGDENEQERIDAYRGNFGSGKALRERGRKPAISETERAQRDLKEWIDKTGR